MSINNVKKPNFFPKLGYLLQVAHSTATIFKKGILRQKSLNDSSQPLIPTLGTTSQRNNSKGKNIYIYIEFCGFSPPGAWSRYVVQATFEFTIFLSQLLEY